MDIFYGCELLKSAHTGMKQWYEKSSNCKVCRYCLISAGHFLSGIILGSYAIIHDLAIGIFSALYSLFTKFKEASSLERTRTHFYSLLLLPSAILTTLIGTLFSTCIFASESTLLLREKKKI